MPALRTTLFTNSLLFVSFASAQSPTIQENWWVTNGFVNAIEVDDANNRVYLGGNFSVVGPNAPFGSKLTYPGTAPDMAYDKPNGRVRAVVSDGNSGWYIGGDFTMVGSFARNKLAHILSDGTPDPAWDPGFGGAITSVYALARDGAIVYVGGDFTSIGGASRNDLARILSNGTAEPAFPENPGGTGSVRALALDGTTLYVGGDFTNIGGKTNLARIDILLNTVDNTWDPNPNGVVRALALSGTDLIAGGAFNEVNSGTTRNHVARFNSAGSATTWNPNVDAPVNAIVTDGTNAYLGGEFNIVNAIVSRMKIARFSLTTGTVDAGWITGTIDPDPLRSVHALALSGSKLAVGGAFETIGSNAKYRLAVVDLNTNTVNSSWAPNPGGLVECLAWSGTSDLFVGGDHACIGGGRWINFLALDKTTGAASSTWAVRTVGGQVRSLLLRSGTLVVGGVFTSVGDAGSGGSQPRNRLAQLNTTDGTVLPWAPAVSGSGFTVVTSLTTINNTLYFGGKFDQVGGQPRNNLAAVDLTIATPPLAWSPDVQNPVTVPVEALATDGTNIFIGGTFTSVNGSSIANLCAVGPIVGTVLPGWSVGASSSVFDLEVDGDQLYAAGDFLFIHGAARTHLTRMNASSGAIDPQWTPSTTLFVNDICPTANALVIGGTFAVVNGAPHPYLASISKATGDVADWNLGLNGGQVLSVASSGATIYAGGLFTGATDQARRYTMAFEDCPVLDRYADGDGDAFGATTPHVFSCSPPVGYVTNNTDCNDSDPLILGPGTWYADADGDGYGDAATTTIACSQPLNTVDNNDDCDDADPDSHPFSTCDDANPNTFGDTFGPDCICSGHGPQLFVTVMLDGPYDSNTGLMRDDLRAAGLIPSAEPYTALGYVFPSGGGGEMLAPFFADVTGDFAPVDWVLVELWNTQVANSVVAAHAAIVTRNGQVFTGEGNALSFNVAVGDYFIAVKHRNHLAAMTQVAVMLGASAPFVSFNDPLMATYGTGARRDRSGTMTLWAGDATFNGQLRYTGAVNDRDMILIAIGGVLPTNTVTGQYRREDVTMDAVVKYTGFNNDRDPILLGIGGVVPTNTRNAQLP